MAKKKPARKAGKGTISPTSQTVTGAAHGDTDQLGEVLLNNGQIVAEVIRESDPAGIAVTHAIRRDATVVDRLLKAGSIDRQMHQAAEQFRRDFELAKLMGSYRVVDLLRTAGGFSEMGDPIVAARLRVSHALRALGCVPGERETHSSRVAWWIIGEQITLAQFCARMRWGAITMNESKASGVLIGATERLAMHYGIVDTKELKDREFGRGYNAALDGCATRLENRAGECDGAVGKELAQVARGFRAALERRTKGAAA